MITIPTVDDVLAELGRSPEELDDRAARTRGGGRRALTRGALGIALGVVLIVIGAVGSSMWHWIWAIVLGTGMILAVAGVVGVAAGARAARDARGNAGRDLLDGYLDALARRLDLANPGRSAPATQGAAPVHPTHLAVAHEGELPGVSLDAVKASGLFPRVSGAVVDDLLTGTVFGARFEIRELSVQVSANYPHGGAYRGTAFEGLLTGVRLDPPVAGAVQVLGRDRGPALRGTDVGLAEVSTGDRAFDEVFEVRATAPEHAAILTDQVRDRLVQLARDSDTPDIAFAFEGHGVFSAIADDKDMFEAPEDASLLTQMASFHDDLALSVRLVDLLGATTR